MFDFQLGFIRGLITLIALLSVLNCSSGKRYDAAEVQRTSPVPTPGYTFSPTPYFTPYQPATVACANASATLMRVSPATASVAVGQDVVFQVTVLNCNSYRIERLDGAPGATFSQSQVWYKKQFTYPNTATSEGIRIIPLNSAGNPGNPVTAMAASFPVVASTDSGPSASLNCSAIPAPGSVNVSVDALGNLISAPPVVNFQISCNRPMRVVNVMGLAGPAIALSTLPSALATSAMVPVTIGKLYQNPVRFTVVDSSDASLMKYPIGEVYLNPLTQVVAPSCTLTVDKPLANPGERVLFTIQSQGNVASATIAGVAVSPYGGQAIKMVSGSETIIGTVTGPATASGPGQTASCQASFSVNTQQVGVNFEDDRDADYNDAVLCMNGLFQTTGSSVVATVNQIVNTQVYHASAGNHIVTVKVVSQYGAIEYQSTFESRNRPTLAIPFTRGSHLEVNFVSPQGRSGNFGLGSQWVRVGNYCNTTGN